MPGEPAGLWNKNLILDFPKDIFFKETKRNNQKKKTTKPNTNIYSMSWKMCLSLLLESLILTFKPTVFEDTWFLLAWNS